jgi:hypothetical protein
MYLCDIFNLHICMQLLIGKLAIKFITSAVGNHKGFTAVYTTGCELLSDTSYTITPGRTSVISGDVLYGFKTFLSFNQRFSHDF